MRREKVVEQMVENGNTWLFFCPTVEGVSRAFTFAAIRCDSRYSQALVVRARRCEACARRGRSSPSSSARR